MLGLSSPTTSSILVCWGCRGQFGLHVKHCGGPLVWLRETWPWRGWKVGSGTMGAGRGCFRQNLGELHTFGGPTLNGFP